MADPAKNGRSAFDNLVVFFAQGFYSGRFPVAPGTVGTLVGFFWTALLLVPGSVPLFFAGCALGFFGAVWLGGRAEEILATKDPGSVVIDEITAVPLAFSGAILASANGAATPSFSHFIHGKQILIPLIAFVGFRFFDVAKPSLIGRSQALPRGWGLVVDDFLAALPVIPITYLVARFL